MRTLRRSADRGHADHGWLDSHHTFSFANYHDPAHMGFGPLRVINEDRVRPAQGFGTHGHRDMEIVSYVISGTLGHRDSMGNGSSIVPGEVQLMSAGTGVTHSEMNPSRTEGVHFLQIWLLPARRGTTPRYAQKAFPMTPGVHRVLSATGADGALEVGQDVELWRAIAPAGASMALPRPAGRAGWLQMIRGAATVDGQAVGPGDALAFREGGELMLTATEPVEALWFDLPPVGQPSR